MILLYTALLILVDFGAVDIFCCHYYKVHQPIWLDSTYLKGCSVYKFGMLIEESYYTCSYLTAQLVDVNIVCSEDIAV